MLNSSSNIEKGLLNRKGNRITISLQKKLKSDGDLKCFPPESQSASNSQDWAGKNRAACFTSTEDLRLPDIMSIVRAVKFPSLQIGMKFLIKAMDSKDDTTVPVSARHSKVPVSVRQLLGFHLDSETGQRPESAVTTLSNSTVDTSKMSNAIEDDLLTDHKTSEWNSVEEALKMAGLFSETPPNSPYRQIQRIQQNVIALTWLLNRHLALQPIGDTERKISAKDVNEMQKPLQIREEKYEISAVKSHTVNDQSEPSVHDSSCDISNATLHDETAAVGIPHKSHSMGMYNNSDNTATEEMKKSPPMTSLN
ncbi:hypothetical protein HPP92_009839 [Vanilla planifolia]|uniref:Uncharacterized protein n=1 Tax=Vanilla planifolia TaxID=51239 RepID=A0A835RD42_VANPL|nr:hypothetical protein HPP92_009839 [Vanilla planifolia]